MDASTEQAIDWLIRLDSGPSDGHASAQDRQAFDRWLQQSPRNAAAWAAVQRRLSGTVDPALAQLRQHGGGTGTVGLHALMAPVPTAARRRGVLRGGLAALLLGSATGWLVDRHTPLATLTADLRTRTAERAHHALPDGSELTLDARSAVDVAYTPQQRLLRLRQGALLVQVVREVAGPGGSGPQTLRPFVVQSAQGSVQALGTRFMVRQAEGRTLVHVQQHSVRLTTTSGLQRTLEQGRSAWMQEDQIMPLDHERAAPAAWVDGVIDVRDQPLGEVIEALRPYHGGVIRVSPEAARLRIFGVFPLAQPEQVLQDLVDTHPVQVRRWGSWLTVIEARQQNGHKGPWGPSGPG
jgi:transmembrane sensor